MSGKTPSVATSGTADPKNGDSTNGDSKTRILRVAAEIAAERGYEGATIARICERSGLPPSSVYWFFTDKDELLGEVVRHSFREWLDAQPSWEISDPGADLITELREKLVVSLGSLNEDTSFLRIGLMLAFERREQEAAARRMFIEIRDEVHRTLTGWFTELLPTARTAADPLLPGHLADLVMIASDGYFLAHQIAEAWRPEEFVELLIDVIQGGLDLVAA